MNILDNTIILLKDFLDLFKSQKIRREANFI